MNHEIWMNLALVEAYKAFCQNEVPVGCVIVRNNILISSGHNTKETKQDALGHAEINAIRSANVSLGSWRLLNCTAYVTLEPCYMCAAAFVNARVEHVVFGALDSKGGAVMSLNQLLQDKKLNHNCSVTSNILTNQSSSLLKHFFRAKRLRKN
jgi:tRNA(adenine34) deaminase